MRTNRILGLAIMIIAWGYSHAISYSGTLPVLHIETEGKKEITSKEDYLNGTYYLDPMGAADIEAIGTKDSPLTLEIKGYGNRNMADRLKRIKERLQQTEDWLVKQWGEGKATSVESVETGLSSEAVYYNLQGMRVEKPVKGQVYILVQGGKSKKVML